MDSIRVKKLRPNAILPTYGSSEAAGADLYGSQPSWKAAPDGDGAGAYGDLLRLDSMVFPGKLVAFGNV